MRNLFLRGVLAATSLALQLDAQVKITQGTNKVDVEIDGKPFTTLVYGADVPKPYMFPLRAVDGTIVTRGVPAAKEAGDSMDHPHQRAVWFAHDRVNGVDYWNNEFQYTEKQYGKMGHMFITKVLKAAGGKKEGEIDFSAEWKDNENKVVLIEDRKTTFHSGGPNRIVDFDFTVTAKEAVTFGDGKDGVFGLRVASGLEEPGQKNQPTEPKRTGAMTSADGCKLEKECWGKQSNWMDYSGVVEGKNVGLAIMDHPSNPKHPTYWHSRGYGLFAANIFGVKQFTKAGDGGVTLQPGEKMRFRYRVVIHSGDAATAKLAALYDDYAKTK